MGSKVLFMSNNTLNWFEINVRNLDASAKLYGAMLDAELKREVLFGIPHAVFLAEKPATTGALIADPKRAVGHGGGVVYFHAKDGVKACFARALEAGAKPVLPPQAIAPFGTIAVVADLDGNHVGLHAPE
jgi:predicted enzyme related to lactoylglutathione lyase